MIKHKILENFLDVDEFTKLISINYGDVPIDGIKVFNNIVDREANTKSSIIEEKLLKKLHNNCHQKAVEILKELHPEKLKLYEYSEFHLIITGKNYKFPIHNDTLNKLLSGVIYLHPEKNKGTIFYKSKKGEISFEVDWKQNRAVFFSRSKNSFHSYESDKNSNRVCLVYNLMTKNFKEVCKIEGLNYYYESFKHFINPYLLRYFGFII